MNIKKRFFNGEQMVGRTQIASVQRSDGNLKVYAVAESSPYRMLQCGNAFPDTIEDFGEQQVTQVFSVAARSFRPAGHGWSHDALALAKDTTGGLVWRLHERGGWAALSTPEALRQVAQLAGWVAITTTSGMYAAADQTPDRERPSFGSWQRLPEPAGEPVDLDNPLGTVVHGDGGWLFTLDRLGQLLGCRLREGAWSACDSTRWAFPERLERITASRRPDTGRKGPSGRPQPRRRPGRCCR